MFKKLKGCLFRRFLGNLYGVLMMFGYHRNGCKFIENNSNLHTSAVDQFFTNFNCKFEYQLHILFDFF